MNINIPPDSREWLFAPRDRFQACLWSLGRFRPKCEVGNWLLFRFDGKIVARAKVYLILRPGEHNCVAHHGLRELKGWKVVWKQTTFQDLRNQPRRIDRIEQRLRRKRRAAAKAAKVAAGVRYPEDFDESW
jgi:hypothetical protein